MFEYHNKQVGTVKQGRRTLIEFPYRKDSIHMVTRVVTSCGCSVANDRAWDSKVVIEWTPREVPPGRNSYIAAMSANVFYLPEAGAQESFETVIFEGTVVR